jgi:hypothetical protein
MLAEAAVALAIAVTIACGTGMSRQTKGAAVSELAPADGGEAQAAHRGECMGTWRVSRVGHGRVSLDFLPRVRAAEQLRRRTRRRGKSGAAPHGSRTITTFRWRVPERHHRGPHAGDRSAVRNDEAQQPAGSPVEGKPRVMRAPIAKRGIAAGCRSDRAARRARAIRFRAELSRDRSAPGQAPVSGGVSPATPKFFLKGVGPLSRVRGPASRKGTAARPRPRAHRGTSLAQASGPRRSSEIGP